VLKLGFLLLLVAGPFFLIIGTHPGFGRIIAIRWFEMLVGVLLKQVAIAIVLSVLLYCYSLIMGTTDAALPWALKILMIALVTVAVFVYRKPFTHLFSAVGYGTLGAQERAEYSLREAGTTFRRSTLDAAGVAIPGVTGYRAARWARRNPGQAAALAGGVAAGPAGAGTVASSDAAGTAQGAGGAYASRLRQDAPPAADGDGGPSSGSRRLAGTAAPARGRALADGDSGTSRTAPPLDLPPRPGPGGNGSSSAASGWSRGAGRPAAGLAASAGQRSRAVSSGSPRSAAPVPPSAGTPGSARSGQPSPAGWPGASTRQRVPIRGTTGSGGSGPRPSAPPAEPPASGQAAGGRGTEEPSPMPFWLRPIRRDK
jgi:hypothetical protein